jgi:pyruvate ferredoxin oxidoreductase alpha subunit
MADVDVITAYPIRPYDTVMQFVSKLIADGTLTCEYIIAESEHSQFEIVKHASAVGARVFTGSSGVGWFYAFEALAVTCGLRLPMVAMVGNRALDDPGAFGTEHNDALAVRDLGWMLRWVDTAEEAMDAAFMAWRVAEDPRVFLPCAISTDGAFLTHSQQIVQMPNQAQVDEFLPPYDRGDFVLHPDNPITIAPQVNEDWLMEIRRQTDAAMRRSRDVIIEAQDDMNRIFNREPENPFIEEYMTEDADVVLVGMGTLSLPLKVTVRRLREKGRKVGFVRVKWFRPFPAPELREALSKFKAVGIIDRDYSLGAPQNGGVLYTEIRSALYDVSPRIPLIGFICGLGGREVTVDSSTEMFDKTFEVAETGHAEEPLLWIGVR